MQKTIFKAVNVTGCKLEFPVFLLRFLKNSMHKLGEATYIWCSLPGTRAVNPLLSKSEQETHFALQWARPYKLYLYRSEVHFNLQPEVLNAQIVANLCFYIAKERSFQFVAFKRVRARAMAGGEN